MEDSTHLGFSSQKAREDQKRKRKRKRKEKRKEKRKKNRPHVECGSPFEIANQKFKRGRGWGKEVTRRWRFLYQVERFSKKEERNERSSSEGGQAKGV